MEGIRTLARQPSFWVSGYVVWICVLYGVSSIQGIPGPEIPHIDKFEHAGFFASGHLVLGIALAARASRSSAPNSIRWISIGIGLVLAAGIVGVLDEFHQSFTPGRNGNDPGDILADIIGGTIAACSLPKAWELLKRFTAR